jgi:hypothetical protein
VTCNRWKSCLQAVIELRYFSKMESFSTQLGSSNGSRSGHHRAGPPSVQSCMVLFIHLPQPCVYSISLDGGRAKGRYRGLHTYQPGTGGGVPAEILFLRLMRDQSCFRIPFNRDVNVVLERYDCRSGAISLDLRGDQQFFLSCCVVYQ